VSGFRQGLSPGVPAYEIIELNDAEGAISWTKRAIPGGTPPDEENTLVTSMVVDTPSVPADTPTVVTYTIQVTNVGSSTVTVDEVRSGPPWHVEYVAGSTTGATTDDPTVTFRSSGESGAYIPYLQFLWPLAIALGPSESLSIVFDAEIDAPASWLCNTAWAVPGGHNGGSGPTAKVQVGTPTGTLCLNEALEIRKTVTPNLASAGIPTTYTYRIEVENHDTVMHDYSWVIDILPPGLTFIGGSVSGNIGFIWGFTNPFQYPDDENGDRLYWPIAPWNDNLNPGQIRYLQFKASGALAQGVHTNEAWAFFWWIGDHVYSFPTAEITVWDVYDLVVANENVSATAQVWMGADNSYHVTQWQVVGNE
jgi:uncharacterized repeat protein (TIGR01451 family)